MPHNVCWRGRQVRVLAAAGSARRGLKAAVREVRWYIFLVYPLMLISHESGTKTGQFSPVEHKINQRFVTIRRNIIIHRNTHR